MYRRRGATSRGGRGLGLWFWLVLGDLGPGLLHQLTEQLLWTVTIMTVRARFKRVWDAHARFRHAGFGACGMQACGMHGWKAGRACRTVASV